MADMPGLFKRSSNPSLFEDLTGQGSQIKKFLSFEKEKGGDVSVTSKGGNGAVVKDKTGQLHHITWYQRKGVGKNLSAKFERPGSVNDNLQVTREFLDAIEIDFGKRIRGEVEKQIFEPRRKNAETKEKLGDQLYNSDLSTGAIRGALEVVQRELESDSKALLQRSSFSGSEVAPRGTSRIKGRGNTKTLSTASQSQLRQPQAQAQTQAAKTPSPLTRDVLKKSFAVYIKVSLKGEPQGRHLEDLVAEIAHLQKMEQADVQSIVEEVVQEKAEWAFDAGTGTLFLASLRSVPQPQPSSKDEQSAVNDQFDLDDQGGLAGLVEQALGGGGVVAFPSSREVSDMALRYVETQKKLGHYATASDYAKAKEAAADFKGFNDNEVLVSRETVLDLYRRVEATKGPRNFDVFLETRKEPKIIVGGGKAIPGNPEDRPPHSLSEYYSVDGDGKRDPDHVGFFEPQNSALGPAKGKIAEVYFERTTQFENLKMRGLFTSPMLKAAHEVLGLGGVLKVEANGHKNALMVARMEDDLRSAGFEEVETEEHTESEKGTYFIVSARKTAKPFSEVQITHDPQLHRKPKAPREQPPESAS